MAKTLTDQHTNASRMSQPCRPISYSLIIRQEGSISGLRTCTMTSSSENAATAAKLTCAAVVMTAGIGRTPRFWLIIR